MDILLGKLNTGFTAKKEIQPQVAQAQTALKTLHMYPYQSIAGNLLGTTRLLLRLVLY
jgi:hypothetical protein